MLEIRDLQAGYGPIQVLRGVSFTAQAGEVTALMARNGAGKTTLLRAIIGQIPLSGGGVHLEGRALSHLPAHEIPRQGIGYVPQGRRLFGPMSVEENLQIGLMTRNKGAETREKVLALFPRLRERLSQRASTLSGGEQQMLAIARALCLEPKVLMLDEPSEGLQPSMIALIRETALRLKAEGVAVLLVEHRLDTALSTADKIVFLSGGRVAAIEETANLGRDSEVFRTYVGV